MRSRAAGMPAGDAASSGGGGAGGGAGVGSTAPPGGGNTCYLLFTVGQFLGFLEVLRREGPRERAFLQVKGRAGRAGSRSVCERPCWVAGSSVCRLAAPPPALSSFLDGSRQGDVRWPSTLPGPLKSRPWTQCCPPLPLCPSARPR